MLRKDLEVFMNVPSSSSQRTLHPGIVVDASDQTITVRPGQGIGFQPAQRIRLYYEIKREFMQQAAVVDATLETDEGPILAIRPEGTPVSAESRQCYRVSTVFSSHTATVADEPGCMLTDVSVTGFSVIAAGPLAQGEVVRVALGHDRATFSGRACVQSIKQLPSGQTRFGFHCVQDKGAAGNLPQGLQTISMAVQREQLRRLAGA
ncbi:MAG: hypothetical protein H6811_04805 [Phycisphaeraceae bacterium]|nr:hypothetical protein [Phycisphaeraceae bacterium]